MKITLHVPLSLYVADRPNESKILAPGEYDFKEITNPTGEPEMTANWFVTTHPTTNNLVGMSRLSFEDLQTSNTVTIVH